jgi:uncharacterized repeat protein (TIGR01451 family)
MISAGGSMLFERISRGACGVVILCLFVHISSALPQDRLSAQTVEKRASGTTPALTPKDQQIAASAIHIPLFFEANEGQTDPSVRYLTRSNGYTMFLTPTETVLVEGKTVAKSGNRFDRLAAPLRKDEKASNQSVLRMELLGANSAPEFRGLEELPGKVNYIIGKDPEKWRSGVALYSEVRVGKVYPGVDLLFHGDQQQLEYDFIVSPGANPDQIGFRVSGANKIEIDPDGDLVLYTATSDFRMRKPVIYQTDDSGRRVVKGAFVLNAKNQVTFNLGPYDRTRELVIDPAINYATFLGGAGTELSESLAVDSSTPGAPKVYVTGASNGITSFPETSTSIGNPTGSANIFIAEIDPKKTGAGSLVFLSFIGGSTAFQSGATCASEGVWLALDASQGPVEPVIGGQTSCADYPGSVLNPITGTDTVAAVVTRLVSNGESIDHSVLLGGNKQMSNGFVSVDASGNVLLTGPTQATNLPTTTGAYATSFNNGGTGAASGTSDCFTAKLQRSDLTPTYLSYLNVGAGSTGTGAGFSGNGCGGVIDSANGNLIYLGGNTESTVAFSGAAAGVMGFQPTFQGTQDAFLMKLDTSLSGAAELKFATYFGGGGVTGVQSGAVDLGSGIVANSTGVVALGGHTTSNSTTNAPDIPIFNAFTGQTTNKAANSTNQETGFFTIMDTTKSGSASLLCGSYFGGSSGFDVIRSLAFDPLVPSGFYIIVGGQTESADFPTLNAFQSELVGTQDGFVSGLMVNTGANPNAEIVFSSYIGGGGDEEIDGLGLDTNHTIYASGSTTSANYFGSTSPATTVNGFQTTCTSCTSPAAPQPDAVIFALTSATSASLESILVSSKGTGTLAIGNTLQFSALGTFSDGTFEDLTNSATWTSSDTAVATVNSTGLVTAVGTGTSTIAAAESGQSNSQQVSVSGGTIPPVTLAPTSLTFSSQTVGTTSAPQGVTVTNTGTGTVTFTGFTVTGANSADFGVPLPNSPAMCNPLQGTLAAGASCTINVLFTPTATGTRTATLNIADGAAGSPQTVTLTGTGGSSPVASLGITKTHTGNFTQGQQGATYTITVSNGAGAGPTSGIVTVTDTIPSGLTLVSLAGTGWTCVVASCTRGDALAGGASYPVITVTVNVAANATSPQVNMASVSGGGSATASTTNPTTITTTGGGGGSGIATVTPSSLAFGGVQVGNSSALSFTLQNTGTGPLGNIAISVVTVTDSSFPAEPAPVLPDYAITSNTCPTNLAVGSAACTVTVTFAPTFQAADPGSVVITDDSSAGPTTVLLSGTGAGPLFVLPFEIFYDGITPGTKSPAQTATLFNATDSEVSVTGVTFVGNAAADFSVASNGCGDGVGTSCPIGVAFTPSTTVLGPRTADLTIATNSTDIPTVVSHLTGNGAIRHLPGFTANVLPPNDDGSSSQINLPFTMNFFGESFTSLFVNNNGNVTFGTALAEFTPNGLNTNNGGIPIIAPFWADVDTSAAAPDSQDAGSPPSGVVTFGVDTVNGHQAFGVNYENVGFFSFHSDKLNSFQLVLIDRSDTGIAGAFDMEFNYDKIQWEAGDASDGNDGLCTIASECAAVGYSNGTGNAGTNFQLAGSFTIGALLDNGPAATSLIHNSLNNPMIGRYLFQVRNGTVQGADLGLAMTQSANTVAAGSNQTYTLNVTNAGPSDATNTTVSDTLPTNATLVSATGSQGAACAGTTVVTCNLGTVANAGAATVTIVVTVNAGATGTVVNTATVVSDLPDPNQPNNTASVTATIGTSTNVTLTIVETGSGMGTVSSVPAGINCPATTCSASFASGTVVALTALPSDGSTFAGWSGGGCTGTGGCSVTMTVAQTVTATFNSGNSPVTIGLAPGSPSTVATTPGSSAVFGLTLTSLPGITGTVTLGCTSTSPNITCNLVPSSITLTGKAINVAIVVNTFCKADVPAFGPSLPGGLPGGLALLLASMSLCGAVFTFKRRPRLALSFGVLLLIAVGMSACSNLPKSPGGQATKPGLYPLVVTATAPNGAVSSVNLTLNVLP